MTSHLLGGFLLRWLGYCVEAPVAYEFYQRALLNLGVLLAVRECYQKISREGSLAPGERSDSGVPIAFAAIVGNGQQDAL